MNERGLNLVPMFVEQTGRGERAYDIYSSLLKDRLMHQDQQSPLRLNIIRPGYTANAARPVRTVES